MVTQPLQTTSSEVIYPDCDGKPMANNIEQFRWILVIQKTKNKIPDF
ncbi:hypothetical protein WJM97_06890 [Okeanomitos corallinicola TIOX110]|uniref:Uncharacterized protein n=1 Tax=Okeanomitos corallinicola TIOX110 TaxID=3133117 RepID=A0ABZ2UWY7_9CYAN